MSDHLDPLTILAFLENDDSIDRAAAAIHLASCAECQAIREDLQDLTGRLGDRSIHSFAHDQSVEADRLLLRDVLMEDANRDTSEAGAAEAFFAELSSRPVETWGGVLAGHPEQQTAPMVERLLRAAAAELDRKPERALAIVQVAEAVAFALPDAEARLQLGNVWKQCSNALRQLARYDEAIDAAILAERFYASLPAGDFDVGQAQYTLAVTLFKMTRYADAIHALARSRATLADYGVTPPLAKTLMLDALIRIEQGDIAAAREMLRELLPIEEGLGQRLEAARVRANLAECNLRLGALDDAMTDAQAAIAAYRALGNNVEEFRASWTVAMIQLARGEAEGLARLHEITAAFRAIGMHGDAGFVQLDVVEELLRRRDWNDAAAIARELVALFMAAGVTLASVTALDYLRRAVEQERATPALVQYVREYVSADDTNLLFAPPGLQTN
jgi:tetratricopeptide (TPR) repeat protein